MNSGARLAKDQVRLAAAVGLPAAAVLTLLLLAWLAGGQSALGRIDPALALPWLMPVLLWLSWRWRRATAAALLRRWGLFLGLLLAVQMALVMLCAEPRSAMEWALTAQLLVIIAGVVSGVFAARALLPVMERGIGWRMGAAVLLLPLWFVISHIVLAGLYQPAGAAAGARPAIMMTSLPLRWSGSADLANILSGAAQDDPVLRQLEALGPLVIVDSLAGQRLEPETPLFLAHPRAMSPQDLVTVDRHVRSGGHAVILADALSSWHSPHPLGDGRNPPITSLLTPLMDHWGVTLNAVPHGQAGEVWLPLSGRGLRLFSAGRFSAVADHCQLFGSGHAAYCLIGKGSAWLIGDADLLQADLWQADAGGVPHLARSEIISWLADAIWGEGAGRSFLRPLWLKRSR